MSLTKVSLAICPSIVKLACVGRWCPVEKLANILWKVWTSALLWSPVTRNTTSKQQPTSDMFGAKKWSAAHTMFALQLMWMFTLVLAGNSDPCTTISFWVYIITSIIVIWPRYILGINKNKFRVRWNFDQPIGVVIKLEQRHHFNSPLGF